MLLVHADGTRVDGLLHPSPSTAHTAELDQQLDRAQPGLSHTEEAVLTQKAAETADRAMGKALITQAAAAAAAAEEEEGSNGCSSTGGRDELFNLLEAVMRHGPWVPTVRAVLGASAAVEGDACSGYQIPYHHGPQLHPHRPYDHASVPLNWDRSWFRFC